MFYIIFHSIKYYFYAKDYKEVLWELVLYELHFIGILHFFLYF